MGKEKKMPHHIAAFAMSVTLAVPSSVSAWCTRQEDVDSIVDFWTVIFPDLRIDVWISIGPESSFLQTGLSLSHAEALVRRAIATHNETVGPPYLVYAGTHSVDLINSDAPGMMVKNGQQNRDSGITVDSKTCERAGCNAFAATVLSIAMRPAMMGTSKTGTVARRSVRVRTVRRRRRPVMPRQVNRV